MTSGVDGDCVKHLGFVARREGLSREAFEAHWFEVHAPLCLRLPGLLRYAANLIEPGRWPGFEAFDGFSELWFASEEAIDAALASPEGVALLADLPNFVGRRVALRSRERRLLWP